MKAYEAKFLTNHEDKSVDQLWSDLTENLETVTDEYIPSMVIKGKPSLPWISHKIKCLIRNRNKFYKSYRKTGNRALKVKYLSLRHQIRRSIKDSHEAYLKGMLGLDEQGNPTVGQLDSKEFFSFWKTPKLTNNVSHTHTHTHTQTHTTVKNYQLHFNTTDKASILNGQFQSVFTPLSPLGLKELSLMKMQDLVDDKVIGPEQLPEDLRNPTPTMPDSVISEAGILNLLKNLIPERQQVLIGLNLSYYMNSERN